MKLNRKLILFLAKRGLICLELFKHWQNHEAKNDSDVVDKRINQIENLPFFLFLGSVGVLCLGVATFSGCISNNLSDPLFGIAILLGLFGSTMTFMAAVFIRDPLHLIHGIKNLDELLIEHSKGKYVLGGDYWREIKPFAISCCATLGEALAEEERKFDVDSPQADAARKKFKTAHSVFYSFCLVERSQAEFVPRLQVTATPA